MTFNMDAIREAQRSADNVRRIVDPVRMAGIADAARQADRNRRVIRDTANPTRAIAQRVGERASALEAVRSKEVLRFANAVNITDSARKMGQIAAGAFPGSRLDRKLGSVSVALGARASYELAPARTLAKALGNSKVNFSVTGAFAGLQRAIGSAYSLGRVQESAKMLSRLATRERFPAASLGSIVDRELTTQRVLHRAFSDSLRPTRGFEKVLADVQRAGAIQRAQTTAEAVRAFRPLLDFAANSDKMTAFFKPFPFTPSRPEPRTEQPELTETPTVPLSRSEPQPEVIVQREIIVERIPQENGRETLWLIRFVNSKWVFAIVTATVGGAAGTVIGMWVFRTFF